MRKLAAIFVLLALGAATVYVAASWIPGPALEIASPDRFVGVSTPLEVVVGSPRDRLSRLTVVFEQDGRETMLFTLEEAGAAEPAAEDAAQVVVRREIGRTTVAGIRPGPARLVATAAWPVLRGVREVETTTVRDVEVRLDPPKLAVLSTHHYVNLGGSEAVVYRVTPGDAESGVVVGSIEYPGYPIAGAAGVGAAGADPDVRIALFALRYDQPLETPIHLFARDEAGNAARTPLVYRAFPKTFRQSRIEISDTLLERVVPAILAGSEAQGPDGPLIDQFVFINSELRRRNADTIASMAAKTSPDMLWAGVPFHPFTNSSAESAFADRRTYYYQGREVDRQVHLGFDLASYAATPVLAAARGQVLFAGELGIYGNCVIIDHGMGLQTLYAHLSVIDVSPGTMVERTQPLGRSGMTGLAGGDHLHFTVLVAGQMVSPVEWWDAHWIEDRILRKLREASPPG